MVYITSVCPTVAPTLTPESMSVEVEVGTPLTLMINITEFNLKVTDVVWTRDSNTLMDQVDGFTITSTGLVSPPGMSVLMLDSVVTPEMHAGTYVANASNPAGSDMSVFNVTITGKYDHGMIYGCMFACMHGILCVFANIQLHPPSLAQQQIWI